MDKIEKIVTARYVEFRLRIGRGFISGLFPRHVDARGALPSIDDPAVIYRREQRLKLLRRQAAELEKAADRG